MSCQTIGPANDISIVGLANRSPYIDLVSGPTSPPDRLWDFATWLLLRLTGPANRLVAEAIGDGDARADYAVLATLAQYGPSSQTALCRRLAVDRSDMVALINHLAGGGWVVRTPDPADRRRNSIVMTGSGRARLGRLEAQIEGAQQEFLAPLTPRERARFLAALRALVAHHRRPT